MRNETPGPMKPPEYDAQGRRLCHAHRTNGEPCRAPAMHGQLVCYRHGGNSPQARSSANLRLANAVEPALSRLLYELDNGDKSSDRIRAAEAILDRGGYERGRQNTREEAKELLYRKMLEIRDQAILEEKQKPQQEES